MSGRPSTCKCPDWPCCGCGEETSQQEQQERFEELAALNDNLDSEELDDGEDLDNEDLDSDEPPDMTDVEADADTLRSCGWGTDEDYGHYDCDTPMGDDYGGE